MNPTRFYSEARARAVWEVYRRHGGVLPFDEWIEKNDHSYPRESK